MSDKQALKKFSEARDGLEAAFKPGGKGFSQSSDQELREIREGLQRVLNLADQLQKAVAQLPGVRKPLRKKAPSAAAEFNRDELLQIHVAALKAFHQTGFTKPAYKVADDIKQELSTSMAKWSGGTFEGRLAQAAAEVVKRMQKGRR